MPASAPSVGYSSAAAARYRLILSLLLQNVSPPARVIELGAAPGEQSLGLAKAGYEVTAVDIGVESDTWENAAEGTMAANFADAGIELVLWDLEKTPYPLADESFDAVVMTEVFEHLRDYPATSLMEARRILKPGGCLYFTTPNSAYIQRRFELLMGHTVHTNLTDWIFGIPFARHAREYTFAEMDRLLRHAALEPVMTMGRHLLIDSGRSSMPARLAKRFIDIVARVRPTLGPMIVIVARRPG